MIITSSGWRWLCTAYLLWHLNWSCHSIDCNQSYWEYWQFGMTIKVFSIDYDAINAANIFSNGDFVTGRITVEVSSHTKIQSLTFTGKGKATVRWTEHYGQYRTVTYYASEKYYKIEHNILAEGRRDGNVPRCITVSYHVWKDDGKW